jgi:hypothetical protein
MIQPYEPGSIYKMVRRDAPDTSIEAAESLDVTRLENLVLGVISSFPDGCISDEVRRVCEEKHQLNNYSSVTARYKSLAEKGLIFYTGEKRRGDSGRNMRVMIAKEKQGRLL